MKKRTMVKRAEFAVSLIVRAFEGQSEEELITDLMDDLEQALGKINDPYILVKDCKLSNIQGLQEKD